MQVEEDAKTSAKAGQKDEKAKPKAKKKTVDKWKKKVWYTMYAPAYFDNKPLGETVAEKRELVQNRVILVSGRDLNPAKKTNATVRFKVKEVKGNKAYTEAVGHEVSEGFMRRLVRRRCSKIEAVVDATTKDNVKVRVKTVLLTNRKSTGAQQTTIHKLVVNELLSFIRGRTYDKVITELVYGNLPQKIAGDAKKITPIKKVEIVKSRVLTQ